MVLKHRDRELLRFEWVGDVRVRVTDVNDAERRFLPLEFGDGRLTGGPDDLRYLLEDWLAARSAPVGRHFMRNLMESLGLNINSSGYVRRALDFSKGLSLNDVYWVVPDAFRGTWAECNLYDNPFSEAMAEIAFTGRGKIDPRQASTSPELTTNGMLPKCWVREEDGIYLYKGGTGGGPYQPAVEGLEPYSEFYAAQVADAFGVRHVKYELARYKGRLCSKCKLFTSERYGYLPASKLPDRDAVLDDVRFSDLFLFDAVIFNVDRHFGNFGYLIDNETNEIADVAPVFDNGYGLFPHLDVSLRSAENDYYAIRNYLRDKHSALFRGWLDFPYEVTAEHLERLTRLGKFRFKKHRHYNWSDDRLKVVTGFLQKRVKDICRFGREADKKAEQSLVSEAIFSSENVGVKSSGGVALNASELKAARLIVRNSSVTAEEIANQLDVTLRQAERIVASLKKKAGLKRRGTDKVGEWYFDE